MLYVNENVNVSRKSDYRRKQRAKFRKIFARHPGAAYQFAAATGIPRSFITMYLSGVRPGNRGKAKEWGEAIELEARRLAEQKG